ncbi:MAG TPA: DNA-directed RNA polymerase subunit alpha [Thermodesulfobacteriota bacterium]|nr:DNA-directed RNA polymerase subunit alpha [Thermodesulfobacteriota bacterium]
MYKSWRELLKPKKLEIESETLTDSYGKFTAEPLERGFGITIGNSLRRILLSSLHGAAISSVRIDKVLHEFSTIPGVREDVTGIIMALKQVRFKLHTPKAEILRVQAKGEGDLKAGDIVANQNVTILNPELHIATLSKDAELNMEMTVKVGRGYVPAEKAEEDGQPIGTIPIDAIYSPIRKVNYTIRNARVGQITDYEKLILEVWTDGSLRPDDAVAVAARILQDQLSIFINFEEEEEEYPEHEEQIDEYASNENLNKSINELELSVRAANCLRNANIRTIGDLVTRTEAEMLKTKNFGRKSLNEIKQILGEMGLSLGMKIEDGEIIGPDE